MTAPSAVSVAVVTGAGSGIGRAVVLRFVNAGWSVALMGRRLAALEETIAMAGGDASRLAAFSADIRDASAMQRFADAVLDRFGRVDALVNAAGTNTLRRSLAEFSPSTYAEVLDTNLHGAVRCTLAFLPLMRRQRSGTIVNINSEAGRAASPRAGAAYTISKFGLTGFTQTLNAEERANGIRACSIFPGDVDTPLVDRRPQVPPPEKRATFLQPADVAEAVWLAASLPARAVVEEILLRQSVSF
jgi:NADP-dependent 3-hydroxy acid dehydrogenase YdfG